MMNSNFSKIFLLVTTCLFSFSVQAKEIDTSAARMQAMDKVTGRVNEITVGVNTKISYGDFSMVLRACKKRPAEETPENFAFIDVTDKSFGKEEYNIFRGWILSSTPGISAIEHPIYDIWLLECIDKDVENSETLTKEELALRDNLPTKEKIKEETKVANNEKEKTDEDLNDTPKIIHIKEFINEDRDIEKDIVTPAYISESSSAYVSEIEEGNEPENLLLFTKMQEETTHELKETDDELAKSIDSELEKLKEN